jgi:hypothetical protein
MPLYTQTTDFGAKDSLTTGNPDKKILGAAYDTEFDAITTAFNTVQTGLDTIPGVGQTWVSYFGSRALDTVYQNTTDKPIAISIAVEVEAADGAQITVENISPPTVVVGTAINSNVTGLIVIGMYTEVPPNHYYKLVTQVGTPVINKWAELR